MKSAIFLEYKELEQLIESEIPVCSRIDWEHWALGEKNIVVIDDVDIKAALSVNGKLIRHASYIEENKMLTVSPTAFCSWLSEVKHLPGLHTVQRGAFGIFCVCEAGYTEVSTPLGKMTVRCEEDDEAGVIVDLVTSESSTPIGLANIQMMDGGLQASIRAEMGNDEYSHCINYVEDGMPPVEHVDKGYASRVNTHLNILGRQDEFLAKPAMNKWVQMDEDGRLYARRVNAEAYEFVGLEPVTGNHDGMHILRVATVGVTGIKSQPKALLKLLRDWGEPSLIDLETANGAGVDRTIAKCLFQQMGTDGVPEQNLLCKGPLIACEAALTEYVGHTTGTCT